MLTRNASQRNHEERLQLYRSVYLADPDAPPSVRSGWQDANAQRYAYDTIYTVTTRAGRVLDLGCANGMLLRHLTLSSGGTLIPHGVDFVSELIDEARTLLPLHACDLHVGHIERFHLLRKTFAYVITNPQHVAPEARNEHVRRCLAALTTGGALILVQYDDAPYFGRAEALAQDLELPPHQVHTSPYAQLHIVPVATSEESSP
jgi:SAM-dependent methyltransferase